MDIVGYQIMLAIVSALLVNCVFFMVSYFVSLRYFRKKSRSIPLKMTTSLRDLINNTKVVEYVLAQEEIDKKREELKKLETKIMRKEIESEQTRIVKIMKNETDSTKLKDYSEAVSYLKTSKPETWFGKNKTVVVSMISSFLTAVVTLTTTLLIIFLGGE